MKFLNANPINILMLHSQMQPMTCIVFQNYQCVKVLLVYLQLLCKYKNAIDVGFLAYVGNSTENLLLPRIMLLKSRIGELGDLGMHIT